MTKCLAKDSETGGIGCDNMTVVVVALLGGRTPEEWQAWVKERVDNNGESFSIASRKSKMPSRMRMRHADFRQ